MRKLIAVLLVLAALPLAAAGKDKDKHKEKRFDPAPVASAAEAAGHYIGPDEQHFVDLSADGSAALNGAPLANVTIQGDRFTATARDGSPVRGRFVNRILNGDSAFGLLMEEPPFKIEGNAVTQPFYRRR